MILDSTNDTISRFPIRGNPKTLSAIDLAERYAMNGSERNRRDFSRQMLRLGAEFEANFGNLWAAFPEELEELNTERYENDPTAIGGKKSFVPALGKIVWELSQSLAARVPFSARIYQPEDGRPIGYVRVPHYYLDDTTAEEFAKVIAHFENATEALVIDQVNNPGGNMFQMYAILSCLTDRVLALPKHHLTLTEDDVARASDIVALADYQEAVPPDERPDPHAIAYSRFILSETKAGRMKATEPGYLGGVSEIAPNQNHYTKKIVVLINPLTFSSAEFLAAILQDNNRATLFGESTPGAGGCVRKIPFPDNVFGLDYLTLTWTVAIRTNGQEIQQKGVHPDVSYELTVDDLQYDFRDYRQALLATIWQLEPLHPHSI
jgi:hypothetical protein